MSKDPSVKPQILSRCEAYDVSELEEIVSEGPPRIFPRIETLVPPGLPLEFEYVDATNPANSGIVGSIPVFATAPREDAYIVEAVPIVGQNPDRPDIMVLWTVSPGTPTPIQFLGYDPRFKAYVDKTTTLLAPDSTPLIDNPSVPVVGTFFDGQPSIFIANGGIDAEPWSGSLDTLLVLNADGKWEDRSHILPRRAGWSHDAALGRISNDGTSAIYIAKINSTPGAGSQILRFESSGTVTEVSGSAAPPGLAYTKDYLSTAFADINSDGSDDLVLGGVGPLLAFLNDSSGNFSNAAPQRLPISPMPEVYSPVTMSNNGPRYMSIEPIVSQVGRPVDLITVSTPFYKGYSVQYLKNDGKGNFTDETETYFPGADMDYISTTDENYVWMKRVFTFNRNGVQDIIARSAGTEEVSSQVFLNNGGVFHSALVVHGYTIENAMEFEGEPVLLIANTQNLALMAYPH